MGTPRTNYMGKNIDQSTDSNLYGPYHSVSSQRPANAQPQPLDLNALFAAFMLQQQQQSTDRVGLQRDRSFGHQLGWGGAGGLTPQTKWDEMFPQGASSLTPEARLASQGPSAMNQWGQLGQVTGVDAGKLQEQNLQRRRKSTGQTYSFSGPGYQG